MRLYELGKSTLSGATEAREAELIAAHAAKRDAYLELLLKCLIGLLYEDAPLLDQENGYNPEHREYGWDWPSMAHSMIGRRRMQNVRDLVESVLAESVPGDLIETGVWRGGSCIFMRGLLRAYDVTDRVVWVADSFAGLPPPNPERYPEDVGLQFHTYQQLAVSLEEVRENFRRYGLLDDGVRFLEGWFRDTLPAAPIERLALLRLDGDMYESTMDALTALYPKLSRGGYVIVDDYNVVAPCKGAVTEYRRANGIADVIREIDGVGVYWKKTA